MFGSKYDNVRAEWKKGWPILYSLTQFIQVCLHHFKLGDKKKGL